MRLPDDLLRDKLPAPGRAWHSREGLRDSAVVLLLLDRGGVDHIVFQQRQPHLPTHAGQASLPGGARHGDEDALACALRETWEEMGIPAEAVRPLGRLPERISIAGHLVAPFVARLDEPPAYAPDCSEVEEVFELPLSDLLRAELWSWRPVTHPAAQGIDRVPYFELGGRTVWGLTGIILRDFLKCVLGHAPRGPRRG